MEELTGGREGSIYQDGDIVIRPLNPWSTTIHRLLTHLHQHGVNEAPKFIGIDGQTEQLSFVRGDTYNYPLTGAIATVEALSSAAKLLRKLHDASASFLSKHDSESLTWMLTPREPNEVICHGDFTPYNVALSGNHVVGVFDFDTAHPAPIIWDLAYSIYCWAPFKTDRIDGLGSLSDQISRSKIFCDSYGATSKQREQLPEAMVKRLTALVDFMHNEAQQGNQQFAANIEQGHHLAYLADIEYIRLNQTLIRQGVC
jgi:hypothetical protein